MHHGYPGTFLKQVFNVITQDTIHLRDLGKLKVLVGVHHKISQTQFLPLGNYTIFIHLMLFLLHADVTRTLLNSAPFMLRKM